MPFSEEIQRILLKPVGTLTREESRQVVNLPMREKVQFQLDNGFKMYKAKEGRQEFRIVAKDLNDATEQANIWNAVIIGTVRNPRL